MAPTPRNTLIANGQALIGDLAWPTGGGPKWHPYDIAVQRDVLHPQLTAVARAAREVSRVYSPRGEVTARLTLHPTFLAKTHFPAHILRDAGLTVLGSRATQVTPRVSQGDKQGPQDTAEILVAGTPEGFEAMDRQLGDPAIAKGRQEEFTHIESVLTYAGESKLRLDPDTPWPDFVHVTLHAGEHDADLLTAFQTFTLQLGGEISARGFRFVPGLAFVAVQLPADSVPELARFERIRLVRSMPRLREQLDLTAALTRKFPTLVLPASRLTAPGPRVAVFDGGTQNSFGAHVVELAAPGLPPATVADLAHGVNVTSALLFGPVDPSHTALSAPPWMVEHHRVLPTNDSPEQALDVLDRIVTALRIARTADRPYRFANISLGPVATFFDDDIHEWTSRLDTELADGRTLCTAAVGNNGALDGELGRIQPPGDAVNLFAIGAADTRHPKWNRAPYSATGPGRSPGFVKPDVLAFGGSPAEPMPVYSPLAGGVVAVGGTSFASPLGLRTALGVDVLSQSRFDPITLQALLINAAECRRGHKRTDVGWGRIPLGPDAIVHTPLDVVRVVYQGITHPGHPQKAVIPVPRGLPAGTRVRIGATFCYRAQVDSAHAINYTRAGLWVRCYKAPGQSLPLFGSGMYKSEEELRRDAMRWDTVLNNACTVDAAELDAPYFHINYQVRDESEAVRWEDAVPMPYALIVTLQAPGVADLMTRVQAEFPVLQTLPVEVQVPVDGLS
ncbi:S8 family peptidase [Xanthomonas euvesicatoria]|uniref:S8 family peptidase n=1 Tax=Xanthomonas euvesicatoria TaxID=456327 RepID=UPI003891DCCB